MDPVAKQQIVERIKQANNILVTVSNNPTVDQLAACIGLTLMLNRLDKHANAVFSGKVPSTIEFLQPDKTLETNTDSLRDFIISLDKSKADKLRYKVEDQVVRIFITPYRTKISEKDLVFSQGDFNVEVVIALGIHRREQIDAAITAHGRILHDAAIISVNAGEGPLLDLGQINWLDPTASSLCEMLVSISEAFGGGLIDNQIATAFLTGIVAATDRFSNTKTSPKVMTMSAQLMAAGANQQLIATKLAPPPPPPPPRPANTMASLQKDPQKPGAMASLPPFPMPSLAVSGELDIRGGKADKLDETEVEFEPEQIEIDEEGNIKTAQELKTESELGIKGDSKSGNQPVGPTHEFMGVAQKPLSYGSAFSAGMFPDSYAGSLDPLSEALPPPPPTSPGSSGVNEARSAVESALATTAPSSTLNISHVDLAPPPAEAQVANGTPVLPIPAAGQPPQSTGNAPPAGDLPPSPPPVPPPIPQLGGIMPNSPTSGFRSSSSVMPPDL